MTGKKCIINFSEKEKKSPRNHRTADQTSILCKDFMNECWNSHLHAGKWKVIQPNVVLQWR